MMTRRTRLLPRKKASSRVTPPASLSADQPDQVAGNMPQIMDVTAQTSSVPDACASALRSLPRVRRCLPFPLYWDLPA